MKESCSFEPYQFLQNLNKQLRQIDQIDLEALQPYAAEANEHKELYQETISEVTRIGEKVKYLQSISEHLKILHELGHVFTQSFDQEQICKKAHELCSRVMPTDAFFLSFYHEGDREIFLPYSWDNGVQYPPRYLEFGKGFISQVLQTKQTMHFKTQKDMDGPVIVRWGNPEKETSTAIFVPMLLGDKVKGVISAQSYREYAYDQEHEELLRIIGIQVANAMETAQLYKKLYQVSVTDELSGLKNYRAFHQDLEKMIAELQDHETITLVMLDSDHLKQVNDRYGHHMGDMMIRRIAETIEANLGIDEYGYRYAGDEFMIVSRNRKLDEMIAKVEKIQDDLALHPLCHESEEIPVSVSVGIAECPLHARTSDTLKRVADQALYESKNKGKNCYTVYQYERV
ncbi:sensor domain-containing diguanylate cyclase [Brevibacillus migulae]|uniref:sensor domain-containing diguanylate cyclase n=1 Tax=Brevibacillus migulae TaxID=1644114 RepID=UPI00106EDD5C|nr:sensor domain-containing diguanylate cyclase [Brevibacillus migulae]